MPKTVLVVEDDDILRDLLVEALSLIDVIAVECSSADDALQLLRAEDSFALVITDVCMPGSMDGLGLAQSIWARKPDLPVILSSGNRVSSIDRLPENASFLRKPWTLDELLHAVGRFLDS